MGTQFVNLTPHRVTIFTGDNPRSFEPSGTVARVYYQRDTEWANGVPLVRDVSARLIDLPAPQDGIIYITSGMVFEAAADRMDVAAPVQPVREGGYVVGCRMLRVR